jgi:50S ribosomal subunit-associated GTPase HflX
MIETQPQQRQERALLIGLEKEGTTKWDLRDSMDELRELASSAGAQVVDMVTQKLQKPTAPYYIGRGKAESIRDSFKDQLVTSVIFDDELSPAQGRNLENLLARKVLDRTQLILDIFAQRARSREGRLQIELAQLQYLLPRLTRMWTHLSRQSGGIGTRGPGETQLEVDRRRVQGRVCLEHQSDDARDGWSCRAHRARDAVDPVVLADHVPHVRREEGRRVVRRHQVGPGRADVDAQAAVGLLFPPSDHQRPSREPEKLASCFGPTKTVMPPFNEYRRGDHVRF